MSPNIASVYLQENSTKSIIHFKKNQIFTFFWHFSTFLKIIFYCINYNYEPIKQIKCQKNVKNCLNLINIELVLEKKLRKKIGSLKKTFWPIRPIFFVVFKIVIFTTVTNVQQTKRRFWSTLNFPTVMLSTPLVIGRSHVGRCQNSQHAKYTTWEKNTKPTDLYITCYHNWNKWAISTTWFLTGLIELFMTFWRMYLVQLDRPYSHFPLFFFVLVVLIVISMIWVHFRQRNLLLNLAFALAHNCSRLLSLLVFTQNFGLRFFLKVTYFPTLVFSNKLYLSPLMSVSV